MKIPNILECLREYIADGGSREVYNEALKELAALKKAAQSSVQRICPYCKREHDTRLACPEYKDFLEWRKRAIR